YAMLRSVFIGDRETFDRVWEWKVENLRTPGDALFGWRWGERSDGVEGFLENEGDNSASDADVDIAFALVLASRRWKDEDYLDDAVEIIDDIWVRETMVIAGKRYLVAGNWISSADAVYINPSYFAPYAWRVFDEVDGRHDWDGLIAPAYELLSEVGYHPLDTSVGVGLPPNWVVIDPVDGTLSAPERSGLTTEYSFDATRVPLRIAWDYQWFQDPRALPYLRGHFWKLKEQFDETNKIALSYSHDGNVEVDLENPAMYATALAAFRHFDRDFADRIYREKIVGMYTDGNIFNEDIPYYEQNILWFGVASYSDYLTNALE
ncbi:MAG: glycosyl hydrolase family 8, partial [Candidatus Dojkabacteria bacterium]|nr:glycosyl hydrolase family 8 [Candidatus Dojkabacteria bacterium]